ncbi:hypothetical protein BABINDRAFT_159567 [Babjeviella inositovora NRRL Y-12698]|uniref:Uncharacterized protein n=1 Tax=Babjeviella inositovora NRRL Y-12698 TaxID=984486 RepID=A0A1E3QZJ8_9ASCO|nr:uncharacterized protein BABINDRAFT_159567 [Babjeviella inositovora NRRL Y-12698]ODQ83109.1 hypothetical protein BABINDRAFT_159567 [Babjeviella inositovora NRRL Y-12698]
MLANISISRKKKGLVDQRKNLNRQSRSPHDTCMKNTTTVIQDASTTSCPASPL